MEATPVARLELASTPGLEAMGAGPPVKWNPVGWRPGRWVITAGVAAVAAVGVWLVVPRVASLTGGTERTASAAKDGPVETKLALEGTFGAGLQAQAGTFAISPDGEFLAYCSREDPADVDRLWLADLSAPERPHEVLASGTDFNHVGWTPDGDRVLFIGWIEGVWDYYAVSPHGSRVEPFTECPARNDVYPFQPEYIATSPDGGRRALSNPERKDLRILPAGSCDLAAADSIHVQGDLPSQILLAWAPRGDRLLLWEGDRRTSTALVLIDADGKEQRTVATDGRGWPFWWSPDGRALWYARFQRTRGPLQPVELRLSSSGAPEGPATPVPWFRDHPVDWFSVSADGSRAVVAREVNRYRVLRVAPGDGAAVVEPVTGVIAGETWFPFVFWGGGFTVQGVDVSADGRWLLLPQEVPGGSDLFKLPVGGGEPVRLTRSGQVYGGIWSPDGRYAAYLEPVRDSVRMRLVSADGRSYGTVVGAHLSSFPRPSWGASRLVYQRPDFQLESVEDPVIEYGQRTLSGEWEPIEAGAGRTQTGEFVVRGGIGPLVSGARRTDWAGGR
jgi:Tol biopolymer transport system component